MSSNKNISRRIKKEILNNDCDYDTLYNELLMYTESIIRNIKFLSISLQKYHYHK